MEYHQNLIISDIYRRLLIEQILGNALLFPNFFRKFKIFQSDKFN